MIQIKYGREAVPNFFRLIQINHPPRNREFSLTIRHAEIMPAMHGNETSAGRGIA
jgi:hypothetical protein